MATEVGIPGNSEDMVAFFEARAPGYEDHMRGTVEDFSDFYACVASVIPHVTSPQVLDLGVGTGLELDAVFDRLPHATVTGIDVSPAMLKRLSDKHRPWSDRLHLIHGSFLERDLGRDAFDTVISTMALHHWLPHIKLDLYRRIRVALRGGGVFVNGDYIESKLESNRRLAAFAASGVPENHSQHIDLPLTEDDEVQLLHQAGFENVTIPFRRTNLCVFRAAVSDSAA
jgi:tRNA (cmo5U34)-methyltransferase